MMATFDDLIQEIDSRYCLGPKASLLVQETFRLIMDQPGGVDGLLERFKAAGFTAEVASWSEGSEPVPLIGQEVEQMLGPGVVRELANRIGLNSKFARTILGYAIPEILLLAKRGAVPSAIPDSVSNVLEPTIALSPPHAKKHSPDGAEDIQAGRRADFPTPLPIPSVPPRFKRVIAYGSCMALAAFLFGFTLAGWYLSGDYSLHKLLPTRNAVVQESAEGTEAQMADELRALKASVEALRAGQSQSQMDALALEGLKTRLDAVKNETSASIADFAEKLQQLQREHEAKFAQLFERLDRLEHQIAGSLTTAPLGAASVQRAPRARKPAQTVATPPKPPAEYARGERMEGGRWDAFEPSQFPAGPGMRRSRPQLMTNWIVRDVYDGIALVESPQGAVEVAPGEVIPGAGRVISIERRGAGWIVITNRGLVDSDGYEPRF